jgi:hypothetical protein
MHISPLIPSLAFSLSALGGGEGWGEVGAPLPHLILNPSPPPGAEKDLRGGARR